MAKKTNTDFRLGLNRQQLIEASKLFGKNEKSAKKSNTKSLENFVAKNLGGTGKKRDFPQFNEKQKRDIKDSTRDFGLTEGLHMVSSRIRRITGSHNEDNFLRLTMGKALRGNTDDEITSDDITNLISRLSITDRNAIISGLENQDFYYQNIIMDYLEEKEEKQTVKS